MNKNIYNQVLSELILAFDDVKTSNVLLKQHIDGKTLQIDEKDKLKAVLGIDDVYSSEGKKIMDECKVEIDKSSLPNITIKVKNNLDGQSDFKISDSVGVHTVNNNITITGKFDTKWVILGVVRDNTLTAQVTDKLIDLCPTDIIDHDKVEFIGNVNESVPLALIYFPHNEVPIVTNFSLNSLQNDVKISHDKHLSVDDRYAHTASQIKNELTHQTTISGESQQNFNDQIEKRKYPITITNLSDLENAVQNYNRLNHTYLDISNDNEIILNSSLVFANIPDGIRHGNLKFTSNNDFVLGKDIIETNIIINSGNYPKIKNVNTIKDSKITLGGVGGIIVPKADGTTANLSIENTSILNGDTNALIYYEDVEPLNLFISNCIGTIIIKQNPNAGKISINDDSKCNIKILDSTDGSESSNYEFVEYKSQMIKGQKDSIAKPSKTDSFLISDSQDNNKIKKTTFDKIALLNPDDKIDDSNIPMGLYKSAGISGTMPLVNVNSGTIGDCEVYLFDNDKFIGHLKKYTISGKAGLSFTQDKVSYIIINYNSGSPEYQVVNSLENVNESDIIPVFSIFNGTVKDLTNQCTSLADGLPNKLHRRLISTNKWERESGMILEIPNSTKSIKINQGIGWCGADRVNYATVLSGTDTFKLCKRSSGSAWLFSDITEYNHTQFDASGSLTTIADGKFTINWVYRAITNDKLGFTILGTKEYDSRAEAELEKLPDSVPDIIKSHAILIGRIIVNKDASDVSVESAFTQHFTPSQITKHNDLANIEGTGTYHITEDQKNKFLEAYGWGDHSVAGYLKINNTGNVDINSGTSGNVQGFIRNHPSDNPDDICFSYGEVRNLGPYTALFEVDGHGNVKIPGKLTDNRPDVKAEGSWVTVSNFTEFVAKLRGDSYNDQGVTKYYGFETSSETQNKLGIVLGSDIDFSDDWDDNDSNYGDYKMVIKNSVNGNFNLNNHSFNRSGKITFDGLDFANGTINIDQARFKNCHFKNGSHNVTFTNYGGIDVNYEFIHCNNLPENLPITSGGTLKIIDTTGIINLNISLKTPLDTRSINIYTDGSADINIKTNINNVTVIFHNILEETINILEDKTNLTGQEEVIITDPGALNNKVKKTTISEIKKAVNTTTSQEEIQRVSSVKRILSISSDDPTSSYNVNVDQYNAIVYHGNTNSKTVTVIPVDRDGHLTNIAQGQTLIISNTNDDADHILVIPSTYMGYKQNFTVSGGASAILMRLPDTTIVDPGGSGGTNYLGGWFPVAYFDKDW